MTYKQKQYERDQAELMAAYQEGECCTENGKAYRSIQDNNPYAPSAYPVWWEAVSG